MSEPPPEHVVTSLRPIRGVTAIRWYQHFFRDPIGCIVKAHQLHGEVTVLGSVVPLKRREKRNILALGPRCNRQVLSNPRSFRHTGQTVVGPKDSAQNRTRYGLTRMNGAVHRRQRELVLPSFQRSMMNEYMPAMVSTIDAALSRWKDGSIVQLDREMLDIAMRIAVNVLFDRENPDRTLELGRLINDHIIGNFSRLVWMFPVNLPLTPYRRLLRHAEIVERAVMNLVEEKRRRPGRDLLSVLVEAHDAGEAEMDNASLVGQACILFGASYETTAKSLFWTLFLLSQHPRAARDALDEVKSVLGDEPPTFESLGRLRFLDACAKESLRMLPAVPFGIRAAVHDAEINGVPVRRGDRVVISHYLTHHLPQLYDEPETFRPARWFEISPGPYEYLPFSAGPRLCVGYTLANTMTLLTTAMVLQRFRLSVLPHTRIDRDVRVTLGPKRPVPVSVHKQDGAYEASSVRGNIHEMVHFPRTDG